MPESPSSSSSSSVVDTCASYDGCPTSNSSTSSSIWPWMAHAKSRLDDPIDLISDHDKRPAVNELVAAHASEIRQVRDKLQDDPLYDPAKHDDLWVLRFLLSHGMKHSKRAAEAAKSTLQFRHNHKLDEIDIRLIPVTSPALLATTAPPFAQGAGKMMACYDSDHTMIYYNPDLRGPLVGFLQLAGRNQHTMAHTLETRDYFDAHLFFTEWKFQWLDYKTRTTGRLTKYLSIADCHGSTTHQRMIHKEAKKQDAAAAKCLEDKYPQLLGEMLVVNAPKWIHVVFAILKPFLPKRLLQKVRIIQPLKKEKDLQAVLVYCQVEHLPTKYGGNLPTWPPVLLPQEE